MQKLYRLDDEWTRELLWHMNGDMFSNMRVDLDWPHEWPSNPINEILRDEQLWNHACQFPGINGTSLARAQSICQQLMWQGKGPEDDQLPKTLRKLWYAGHKESFQRISERLKVWRKNGKMDDTQANATLSKVYGEFVDTGLVTYLDLYVKDGSRTFQVWPEYERLPAPLGNILFAIEKDAAYEDVSLMARALGAAVAMSGGGKMGKAGTENMVRAAFSTRWDTETPGDLVTADNPLYVLVISDWDYDGEAVIAKTFVDQIERYIDKHLIQWVRVGIEPRQVTAMGYTPDDKAYRVKNDVNGAYSEWCQRNGLFNVNGHWVQGMDHIEPYQIDRVLPSFLTQEEREQAIERPTHKDLVAIFKELSPWGYELDALKRVEYATLVIDGLLEMIPWDTLIDTLSRKAWSNNDTVTQDLVRDILKDNPEYSALAEHLEELKEWFAAKVQELEDKAEEFESDLYKELFTLVEQHDEDDRIKDNDPYTDVDQLVRHMRRKDIWNYWQPFSRYTRNAAHQHLVEVEHPDKLDELRQRECPFERVELE